MTGRVAALVAVVTFIAVKVLLDLAGGALGVASYIDFGAPITVDHGLYDEEVDGAITDFGIFALAAAAMIAWRVYHWICAGSLQGNLTREQRATWLVCLAGSAAYTALSLGVNRLGLPYPLPLVAKLAIACGTYYLGRRWYLHQKRKRSWADALTENLNRNARNNTPTL